MNRDASLYDGTSKMLLSQAPNLVFAFAYLIIHRQVRSELLARLHTCWHTCLIRHAFRNPYLAECAYQLPRFMCRLAHHMHRASFSNTALQTFFLRSSIGLPASRIGIMAAKVAAYLHHRPSSGPIIALRGLGTEEGSLYLSVSINRLPVEPVPLVVVDWVRV